MTLVSLWVDSVLCRGLLLVMMRYGRGKGILYFIHLFSLLDGCCTKQIVGRRVEWKERVLQLENDHDKDFKKIKTLLKKKKESIGKMEKKLKNGKYEPELGKLRDNL